MPKSAAHEYEVGVFPTPEDAHYAVQDLLSNGISRDLINVVNNDPPESTDHDSTIAASATLVGLIEGLVYGGILGTLIGLGCMFFIPAGIITISPMMIIIACTVLGAVVVGSAGWWVGYHIPRDEAEYVVEGLTRAATAVTVQVDERSRGLVAAILDRDGAVDVEMEAAATPLEAIQAMPPFSAQLSFH